MLDRTHGPNYLLIGTHSLHRSCVFVGVMLAMQGGLSVPETVDTCLREPAGRIGAGAF
jgi:hypothetical protein